LPFFAKANAILSANRPYDPEKENRFFKISENCFDNTRIAKEYPKLAAIVPIFVVGQPRSGTTLLEMMLSSADDIYGCGELSTIEWFCQKFLDNAQNFSTLEAEELAKYYVDNLPGIPKKVERSSTRCLIIISGWVLSRRPSPAQK